MENNELIKQCTEKAQTWLTAAYDAETQAEVKAMLENPDKTDLIDAFYKDLEFGCSSQVSTSPITSPSKPPLMVCNLFLIIKMQI